MKRLVTIIMTLIMAFVLVGCKKTPEFSFDKVSYSMVVGDEEELVPTIKNVEGTDLVLYEIADATIVKIEGNKLVALKEGTTKITASLKNFEDVPKIELSVVVTKIAVTKIEINGDNKVRKEAEIKLTAKVTPDNATYKTIKWTSADETIATVDSNGVVKGLKLGKVTIKAEADGIISEFEVDVIKPLVKTIIISGANTMEFGSEQTLTAKVDPEDADKKITWESSDKTIATVSAAGLVKALKVGEVTIKAKASDDSNIVSEFKITITEVNATEVQVELDKLELTIKDTAKATATVLPELADQKVTWKSSDENLATIDAEGNITAIKAGTVTITATAKNGVEKAVELVIKDLDKRVVLVNKTYVNDTKFVEDGKEYIVGINAFNNIKDAVANVAVGGRIIISAGTYDENLTIKNGLSLIGANANINPITGTRIEETIFTGVVTIDGASNVNINGIKLTGNGKIETTDDKQVNNVVVSNVLVNEKGEATSVWTSSGRDYANNGAINFIQQSNDNLHKKIVIKDSKFDTKDYAIKLGKCMNITVSGCYFENFERDAIRIEGGFNGGAFNFKDNTFINGQKGYNGIYFNYYGNSAALTEEVHTMNISGNTFTNIGNGTNPYSGAVTSRGYQEGGAVWYFTDNTFENCYNYMTIRNNATADNHAATPWSLTASFNKFIGIPEGNYYTCRVTSGDNDATAPAVAKFDHNIFLDDTKQNVITPSPEKFKFYAENVDAFESLIAYEMFKLGIEDPINYVVNGNWATTAAGEKVMFAGVEYTLGTNAFATIKEAMDVAKENEGIYLFPGTYSETVNITKSGIKLYGPNAGINPNFETRAAEAIIEQSNIVIGAGISNVKLQGIQINGKAKVDVLAGTDHLIMKNCLLTTKNGSGANPVIAGYDNDGTVALNKNFEFINNRFIATTNPRIVGFYSLEGLIFDGNYVESPGTEYNDLLKIDRPIGEIIVKNNQFVGCGQDGMFIGLRDNHITKMEIVNNIFSGCGKLVDYGQNIDIRKSAVENAEYIIQYNTFTDIPKDQYVLNIKGFTAAANVKINHNKFYGISKAIVNSDNANITFDLEENYFEDKDYATKVSGATITKVCATPEEVKEYPLAPKVGVKDITIISNPGSIFQLEEYKLEFEVTPANATNKKVNFSVSDEKIATVDTNGVLTGINPGYVTVYITSDADNTIEASMEIEVKQQKRIDAILKGETVLSAGEKATLETTIVAGSSDDKVVFSSSDEKVLKVDETGVVTAIGKGTATITISLQDNAEINLEFTFTVLDDIKQLNELLQQLIKYHNSTVLYQNVHATGYQFEYEQFTYGSVNLFDFEPLEIDTSIETPINSENRPGTKKKSIEYITIHNTDSSASSATARAHANYVKNGGGGTSWGYSTGNDGIYKQLPDDEVSFHAGDGRREFKLEDTGVKVTVPASEAKIALDEKGNYTINGQPTNLRPYLWNSDTGTDAPDPTIYKTSQMNLMGLTLEEKNGRYYLNKTFVKNGFLCSYGGNRNSIGMETMVNIGSNLELTQHRAAKLASNLCIKYNLPTSRIVGHHFFMGKNCPQTLMENDLWDRFKTICDAEYDIQKNYKDYTIELESHNPDVLDNKGMIIKAPAKTMTVSYTIKVSKGSLNQSVTLTSVVPGCLVNPYYNWHDNPF